MPALRDDGGAGAPAGGDELSEREERIADVLQRVWFASLIGWNNGLHAQSGIVEQTRIAAELLLRDEG